MSFNELIINGGFETGAFPPWIASNVTITNLLSHSGFFSAQFASGNINAFISQFVPVNPGERYEFLASLGKIGPTPNPLVSISIAFFDEDFNFLGTGLIISFPMDFLPNVNERDWIEVYQTTSPAPVGATQALVTINKLPQAGTAGILVDDVSLLAVEVENGPGEFEWGECIIWADSSAPGPGTGTPFDPFNSLQAAIDAAVNSPLAVDFGMRARCIVLIAGNSVFDEDIVIPPARHVQLLGLGPWVLGNADLANFDSSVPRNITIQTSQAEENVYLTQGPAFVARPVTVIGTLNNGTSVSTHTNYTNGAIISGNVSFQNLDPVDPFTTIEFQLLNARVVGDIIGDPVDPHMGILNTYIFNSRITNMIKPGLRIQRMVDVRVDGTINVAGYSNIVSTWFRGDVTVASALADVPPTGIFNSQFNMITWTGPLVLDTASNFYFVNTGSTLVGVKTVLFSIA
ncbi:NTTRR-F1 domain [Anaerovirgula multivorans]|nr:NTTRR-F1 domain [Anaerovirgula multivorans]